MSPNGHKEGEERAKRRVLNVRHKHALTVKLNKHEQDSSSEGKDEAASLGRTKRASKTKSTPRSCPGRSRKPFLNFKGGSCGPPGRQSTLLKLASEGPLGSLGMKNKEMEANCEFSKPLKHVFFDNISGQVVLPDCSKYD